MKYQGSCHCGNIKFEFESVEIVSAIQCNCSICIRKNAIMSKDYIAKADFKLLSGEDYLSKYLWGDKDVNHYFCSCCGVYPFHDGVDEPGKFRVNLGCINGVEPRQLELTEFDGRALL